MSYRDEYEGTKYKYVDGIEQEYVTTKMLRADYIERLLFLVHDSTVV